MGAIASQITSLTIIYSIVYSDGDQRKHQSSASLAFVRGIHRGPMNYPHKWPVTRNIVSIWWRHHASFEGLSHKVTWLSIDSSVLHSLKSISRSMITSIYKCINAGIPFHRLFNYIGWKEILFFFKTVCSQNKSYHIKCMNPAGHISSIRFSGISLLLLSV